MLHLEIRNTIAFFIYLARKHTGAPNWKRIKTIQEERKTPIIKRRCSFCQDLDFGVCSVDFGYLSQKTRENDLYTKMLALIVWINQLWSMKSNRIWWRHKCRDETKDILKTHWKLIRSYQKQKLNWVEPKPNGKLERKGTSGNFDTTELLWRTNQCPKVRNLKRYLSASCRKTFEWLNDLLWEVWMDRRKNHR